MSITQSRINGDTSRIVATIKGNLYPLGYVQLTSVATATALSPPTGARLVFLFVEGQALRWRDDGVSPTATVGVPFPAGSSMFYDGDLSKLSFIQQAPSATVNIVYYT